MRRPAWIMDAPEIIEPLLRVREIGVWDLRLTRVPLGPLERLAVSIVPEVKQGDRHHLIEKLLDIAVPLIPRPDYQDAARIIFDMNDPRVRSATARRTAAALVFGQSYSRFRDPEVGFERPLLLSVAEAIHKAALEHRTPAPGEPDSGDIDGGTHAADSSGHLQVILANDRVYSVESTDPYEIGVFPSTIAREASQDTTPYIERGIDKPLRDLLLDDEALEAQQRIVVVRGDPKAGKSRTLYEALKATHPTRPMVALRTPLETDIESPAHRPLATLAAMHGVAICRDSAPVVVWIDDAQRHLQRGFTRDNLRVLRERYPDVIIAVTLHNSAQPQFDKFDEPLGRLLRRASRHTELSSVLERDELAQARLRYSLEAQPDQHVARLPELFAAVNILQRRYQDHQHDDSVGVAIVQAAVNWRRTGMPSAIDEKSLQALSRITHGEIFPYREIGDQEFRNGLAWACKEVAKFASLVRKIPYSAPPVYEAFDAISQWLSDREPVPSSEIWDYVETRSTPETGLGVGFAAFLAGHGPIAQRLWRDVSENGHPDHIGPALLNLGATLAEAGDTAGACTALRRVIELGYTGIIPSALLNLGSALSRAGDVDGAKDAFQQAIDLGRADQAVDFGHGGRTTSFAALSLGQLLENSGDPEGAEAAYRQAIDSGDSDAIPKAALNLGVLLDKMQDHDGACLAYRQAVDSGDSGVSTAAALGLGQLLFHAGDLEGSKAAYRHTIDFGSAEQVSLARLNFGVLLEMTGDSEGAKAAYRQAVDADGAGDAVPEALFNLGRLLGKTEETDGARTALLRAIASGNAEQAPRAAARLGVVLSKVGDVEGAEAAFRQAIDSGHAYHAPVAALGLGTLLFQSEDTAGARAAFQRAIDFGDSEVLPSAALGLGGVLAQSGDVAGAEAAFQRAIDSGYGEVAPRAALGLGTLLLQTGDTAGARAAFQRAIDLGDSEVLPSAVLGLGRALAQSGDVAEAKTAFQRAIDSGHDDEAARAALGLGGLLTRAGDTEEAKAAFQRAIDSGHRNAAPRAALELGQLLNQPEDAEEARTALQQAIDSGHSDSAPRAIVCLAVQLALAGDVEGAKVLLPRAIDSDHEDAAPMAMVVLGLLLQESGDTESARTILQRAVDSGNIAAADKARAALVEHSRRDH
ncbi:tetratricopeptide repeat protein [Streptomyces sp. NBC_00435]|uniref:tetratricopeptide repeat protein n=1 Tax=Streptomyces sp. NBC_00435 TaxID=2903649 RepID=UPI002E1D391A